jgi:hypothetical protein
MGLKFKVGDRVRWADPPSAVPHSVGIVAEVNPTHTPFNMGCAFDYYVSFPEYPKAIQMKYAMQFEIKADDLPEIKRELHNDDSN